MGIDIDHGPVNMDMRTRRKHAAHLGPLWEMEVEAGGTLYFVDLPLEPGAEKQVTRQDSHLRDRQRSTMGIA